MRVLACVNGSRAWFCAHALLATLRAREGTSDSYYAGRQRGGWYPEGSELQGQGGVMVLTWLTMVPVVDNASGLGAEIWEEGQGEPGS